MKIIIIWLCYFPIKNYMNKLKSISFKNMYLLSM